MLKDPHEIYDTLNDDEKEVVDNIYDVVNSFCKSNNIPISYDDRAEYFVDSIAKYLQDSKEIDELENLKG